MQPCPTIDAPGDRPTGREVAPCVERHSGRLSQIRRLAKRNLAAGIQSVQMRNVAVPLLSGLLVPILEPFLQLAALADLIGRQPTAVAIQLGTKVGVDAENLRRANAA